MGEVSHMNSEVLRKKIHCPSTDYQMLNMQVANKVAFLISMSLSIFPFEKLKAYGAERACLLGITLRFSIECRTQHLWYSLSSLSSRFGLVRQYVKRAWHMLILQSCYNICSVSLKLQELLDERCDTGR